MKFIVKGSYILIFTIASSFRQVIYIYISYIQYIYIYIYILYTYTYIMLYIIHIFICYKC